MSDRQQLEALFVESLTQIDRIAQSLGRRHRLEAADLDEFKAWLRLKLVENEYAAFKQYRGESALSTYLMVVVTMLFRDFRAQLWGRWRPSAAAQRAGHFAIRLETLIRRDHLPLREAAELLRTSGETTLSDGEIAELLKTLPERGPLRPVKYDLPSGVDAASGETADRTLLDAESGAERKHLYRALSKVVSTSSVEEQAILRMYFWDNLTVAQIARALQLEQKPLYRQLERILKRLRAELEECGIAAPDVQSLLTREDG